MGLQAEEITETVPKSNRAFRKQQEITGKLRVQNTPLKGNRSWQLCRAVRTQFWTKEPVIANIQFIFHIK